MSIEDRKLHKLTTWKAQISQAINAGPAPTNYGSISLPKCRAFSIAGPPWSGYLNSISRPICPNSGLVTLAYDIKIDEACYDLCNIIETDSRISIGGNNYNGSLQNNFSEGGMIQVNGFDKNGKDIWIDTGFKPGKYVPGVWYPVNICYRFSTILKTMSIISCRIGNQFFVLPTMLQNLTVTRPTPLWADSINCQWQLGVGKNAALTPFTTFARRMRYIWE